MDLCYKMKFKFIFLVYDSVSVINITHMNDNVIKIEIMASRNHSRPAKNSKKKKKKKKKKKRNKKTV